MRQTTQTSSPGRSHCLKTHNYGPYMLSHNAGRSRPRTHIWEDLLAFQPDPILTLSEIVFDEYCAMLVANVLVAPGFYFG